MHTLSPYSSHLTVSLHGSLLAIWEDKDDPELLEDEPDPALPWFLEVEEDEDDPEEVPEFKKNYQTWVILRALPATLKFINPPLHCSVNTLCSV